MSVFLLTETTVDTCIDLKSLNTTTAFQTSDVSFLGKTYMHSAGRTTGNGEPKSLSLGAAKVIILCGTGK